VSGGTIAVESEPGRGTTFSVEIPVGARPSRAPAPRDGAETLPEVTSSAILVVDDEPDIAATLAEAFRREKHPGSTEARVPRVHGRAVPRQAVRRRRGPPHRSASARGSGSSLSDRAHRCHDPSMTDCTELHRTRVYDLQSPSLKEALVMVKLGVSLICMLGFAVLAVGQSAFDGAWTAQVVRPAPNPNQNLTITLKSDAGKVSGSIVGADPGEKGDLITFRVKMHIANVPQTMVYIGKLAGDQIDFGRRPEDLKIGQLVEFTAKRSK
jgi:hypothetical protein